MTKEQWILATKILGAAGAASLGAVALARYFDLLNNRRNKRLERKFRTPRYYVGDYPREVLVHDPYLLNNAIARDRTPIINNVGAPPVNIVPTTVNPDLASFYLSGLR